MAKKARLLQIVGEPVGGTRKHVHSILQGIDRAKFDLFYCYSTIGVDSSFQSEVNDPYFCNIQTFSLRIHKTPHYNDLQNIVKILRFVKRNEIDIVHGHGAKAGTYARLLKCFANVKCMYTPHGGVLHDSFGMFASWVYLSVEKLLKPFTDLVIVESRYSKNKYLEKVGNLKGRVILNYNGVSIPKKKLEHIPSDLECKPSGVTRLAIFARLHQTKGQEIAIKALANLPSICILHLFGDGPDKDRLLQLASDLSLKDRVFCHGDLPSVELLMTYIDVVLIPSSFESFSYVAVEAMMMRRPVIANAVGGLEEVLDEGSGILLDNIDEANLAEAVLLLMDDNSLKARLVKKGYARFNELFHERTMLSNLEKIYASVL